MRGPASPVFTARITDVYFDKTHPPCPQSGLELRLFLPDEPPVWEGALPLEYTLQGETADSYVHFLIQGIDSTVPEELHRLCLLLLMVRDTLYDGLATFADHGNR